MMAKQANSSAKQQKSQSTPKENKRRLKTDAAFFGILMLIALFGVGLTDLRGIKAVNYWDWLMVIFAITTTVWGIWHSRKDGLKTNGKLLYQQAIVWGAAFVAMTAVYLLQTTGRLNFEATGLLMLLILATVTFIDGLFVSWMLYAVGVLLLATMLLALYVEQFLWMIILLAVVLIIAVGIYVYNGMQHRQQSATSSSA